MLAYYWVLATPGVGFLFGAYLYVCVNWFHVHYDEAFSSLQIADHKGFCRLHITPAGDLHIYGLAMDKVDRPDLGSGVSLGVWSGMSPNLCRET